MLKFAGRCQLHSYTGEHRQGPNTLSQRPVNLQPAAIVVAVASLKPNGNFWYCSAGMPGPHVVRGDRVVPKQHIYPFPLEGRADTRSLDYSSCGIHGQCLWVDVIVQ